MKAVLLTIVATAALAIAAPAALAGNWHQVRDGNAWVYSSSDQQGLTLITDTLGGNGRQANAQPYLYGGAPRAVVDSYQAYIAQLAKPSRTGFYRANYSNGSDTTDRYIARTIESGTAVSSVSTHDGFNWADAGVGAGTALGALLLLMGAATLAGRRRRTLAL
jgi:hypothetical protein